jgi:hypothetical protein
VFLNVRWTLCCHWKLIQLCIRDKSFIKRICANILSWIQIQIKSDFSEYLWSKVLNGLGNVSPLIGDIAITLYANWDIRCCRLDLFAVLSHSVRVYNQISIRPSSALILRRDTSFNKTHCLDVRRYHLLLT